jgi:hypothetical protein
MPDVMIDCSDTLKIKIDQKEFQLDGNKWEGEYSDFFSNSQPEKCPMNQCAITDCENSTSLYVGNKVQIN